MIQANNAERGMRNAECDSPPAAPHADLRAPDSAFRIPHSALSERLTEIKQRIVAACARAGRTPSEITLVAVSKTVPASRIRTAIEAGVCLLGENRVQEAETKITELREETNRSQVEWHLIGHLQTNKARRAVELFDVVQSVDS